MAMHGQFAPTGQRMEVRLLCKTLSTLSPPRPDVVRWTQMTGKHPGAIVMHFSKHHVKTHVQVKTLLQMQPTGC
jgi:hypothetical protein